MNDNISPEKGTGARTVLTTEKITSVFGEKERPAIGVQKVRPGRTGETRDEAVTGEADIYLVEKSGRKRGRLTVFESLQALYEDMEKKARKGIALTEREMENLKDWFTKLPGVDRWDLGRYTGEMINQVSKGDPIKAQNNWETMKDVGQRIKMRRENSQLALIWDYVEIHGGDPEKIQFDEVIAIGSAIEAIEKGEKVPEGVLKVLAKRSKHPSEALREMKEKENKGMGEKGGWKDEETKLKAYEYMLGMHQKDLQVDVQKFWKERFLEVIEVRLAAMRSPERSRLHKSGKKMEIFLPTLEKLKGNVRVSSRLTFEILDPGSEVGKFLNEMGKLDFWRGKAAIDRQWSLYTGVPLESAETRAARPSAGMGLFSVLNKERLASAEVVECCGPEAELQIAQDDRVCDALNILYHLAAGKTYKQSLEELREIFQKKYNINIKEELPREVIDAIKIAYFYGFDIRANGNDDARYNSWLVGEFQNLDWMTNVEGKRINLLGPAFALKPDDMANRGFFSGRNASLLFSATTGSPEVYDHNNPSHRREMVRSGFFYLLGLDRGLNELVRHYDVNPATGEENVLPGTKGKFERFHNKDERHRKAVFTRWKEVLNEDAEMPKACFDDQLRTRMRKVLLFFRGQSLDASGKIISAPNQFGTTDQIYYDPATMAALPIWNELDAVFQDPRAWGMVGDFRDTELQQRNIAPTRYTMENSLLQDCAAEEAASKITQLLKKPPNTIPEELETFPAQIMELAMTFGFNYNSELNFRNLMTLMQTVALLGIERFLQVQIPSRELVEEIKSKYKLFSWERIFQGIKRLSLKGKTVESTETEFFLRQIEEEERITEEGIVGRFDNAMEYLVNLLDTTEAFGWDMERSMFMEKRAFIYQYLFSWLNRGRPVEGHKTPVVIQMKDGSLKVRGLCVQDLTYREVFGWKKDDTSYEEYLQRKKEDLLKNAKNKQEKKEIETTFLTSPPLGEKIALFSPMERQEIGKTLGGLLKGRVVKSERGLAVGSEFWIVSRAGGQVNALAFLDEAGIEQVRLTLEEKNIQVINHSPNGWQRPGEVMLEGMRVVWEENQYIIKLGSWERVREAGNRFKFTEGEEGYSRVWEEMNPGLDKLKNHQAWLDKVKIKERGGELVKEVHLPCLKATEEQWQQYCLHRYVEILFQLITGRAQGGATPGQAVIDLDAYYENPKGFISQLIRQVRWLELTVEKVQGKQALRGMATKGEHLLYEFVLMSENARERYVIAKAKEFEGNIGPGMQQKLVEASDAIVDEEVKLLNKNFWHKAGLWLNKTLKWKKLSIPIGIGTVIEGVAINFAVKAVTGLAAGNFQAGSGLTSILVRALGKGMEELLGSNVGPILPSIIIPGFVYAIGFTGLYFLTLTGYDRLLIQKIIKTINNHKAPDFSKFFGEYLDQNKNKTDAFFPMD